MTSGRRRSAASAKAKDEERRRKAHAIYHNEDVVVRRDEFFDAGADNAEVKVISGKTNDDAMNICGHTLVLQLLPNFGYLY